MLESIRMFMRYTCGIPHRTMQDTKLSGYDVPKNTMLVPLFQNAMTDREIFKSPLKFDPENFLDDNGKLKIPEMFIPFGLGKHRCKGEVMAKSNLFLLCTMLIQNFYFDIPLGHDVPSDFPQEGATPGVKDYKALIILRN
jgi:cytochrome P450